MSDPLDDRVDVGPNNEYLELILTDDRDPLRVLVDSEEADRDEGRTPGATLDDYLLAYRYFIHSRTIMNFFKLIAIDKSFPKLGIAAQRSVATSLNFTIAALISSEIRRRMAGVPESELAPEEQDPKISALLEKYNNTLDRRNEADEHDRGQDHSDAMTEELGYELPPKPLELAARLKVVRDHFADALYDNARWMRDPIDPRRRFKDPYETAPSLRETLVRQMATTRKTSDAAVRALAEAHGISEDDVRLVLQRREEGGRRFIEAHKDEIASTLDELIATSSDGSAYGDSDVEQVFESLPPIQRAKLYRAADLGLFYERARQLDMLLRGSPDASGNLAVIDATREQLHRQFATLMKHEPFARSIEEAVRNGATYPVLPALAEKAKKTA